jgi:transcription initiation factor TFIID subunit 2
LENKEYKTIAQFESDFRLMLNNCYQYNSPGTYVYNEGQTLEAIFEKELANITGPPRDHDEAQNRTIVESPRPPASATAPPSSKPKPKPVPSSSHTSPALATSTSSSKSAPSPVAVERRKSSTPSAPTSVAPVPTPPSAPQKQPSATPTTPSSVPERKPEREKTEREKMMGILSRTIENRHAFEFLRPVDPIKQGIPHYTTIIKTPMDLGKIKSRFKNDQYTSATQMDDDMRLMFNNCYTFNPPDTYVYNEAKQLEEAYNKEWRSNFGKRRSSTSSSQKSSSSSPIKVKSNPTKTVPHKAPAETSSPVPKPVSKPQPSSSSPVVQPSEPAKAPPVKIKAEKPKSPTVAATTNGHSSKSSESKSVEKPKTKLVAAMDANNKKRCQRIMNKLWQHQGSQSFYEPVDAVALNVPQYYELIKRPMDLGTIRKALEKDKYTSIWSYEKDIRQIFWNCYSFNHPESWVVEQARGLETFFNQIFAAEFSEPNALKGEDRRLAQKVVNKLTLHDAAALFNEPVDMDSLPGYSDIVKRPMDLRTIWERLESGKYTSLKALDQDIRQVFKNCFDFNDASSFGSAQGKKLEKYYQNISKEIRARIAATKPVSTPGSPSSSIPAKRAHQSESSSKHPVKLSKPVDTTKSPSRAESERSTSQEAPSRMHPTLTDRLESFLKRLMNNKAAMGFLEPVSIVNQNVY